MLRSCEHCPALSYFYTHAECANDAFILYSTQCDVASGLERKKKKKNQRHSEFFSSCSLVGKGWATGTRADKVERGALLERLLPARKVAACSWSCPRRPGIGRPRAIGQETHVSAKVRKYAGDRMIRTEVRIRWINAKASLEEQRKDNLRSTTRFLMTTLSFHVILLHIMDTIMNITNSIFTKRYFAIMIDDGIKKGKQNNSR